MKYKTNYSSRTYFLLLFIHSSLFLFKAFGGESDFVITRMLSNYEVSLVNYDTQAPETLNDVFYSLKQLSSTIDNIYQKIETRFSTEKFRLDGIKLRIANCQNKINRIKGSKRATAVYSTAHFPAPKKPTLYASVLANATVSLHIKKQYLHIYCSILKFYLITIIIIFQGGDPFRPADDSTHYIPADTKESAICNPKLNDDLTIMLTRLHSVQEKTAILYSEIKGLGSIPTTIESVSSLLVFNSSSNPYKDYLTVDNLDSAGRYVSI